MVDNLEALSEALPRLRQRARQSDLRPMKGRILRVVGTMIHAAVPEARIGEICKLHDPGAQRQLPAEVVGLAEGLTLLSPIGELHGLSTRTEVVATGHALEVPFGPGLLGRALDSLGRPLDISQKGELPADSHCEIYVDPPNVLSRRLIEDPLPTGIRAIDGMLSCGEGQRIGIFGEPGAGKSSLIAQIVRDAKVDVVVIALIGERGREVREFIDRHLDDKGRERSVIVVATSDRPAMERVKAAYVATTIAERFRDEGRRVLLLMDSITRFARAQREIGLAAGEPPTRRGFPPSVFAALPRLLERAGMGDTGSITAFYTILVEGDRTADPVAEETRAILDGHIMLSTELGDSGHFPAIDVLASRSRLMDSVVSEDHRRWASHVRDLLARHASVEFLIQVGEYQQGKDPLTDRAVDKIEQIRAFLRQDSRELAPWDEMRQRLEGLAS